MPTAWLHVDGDVCPADSFSNLLFEVISDLVSFIDREVLADREMEVNQLLGPGPPGSQVVVAE